MKNVSAKAFPAIFTIILGFAFSLYSVQIVAAQAKPLTFPDITTALNTKVPNKFFKTKDDLINWLIGEVKKRKVDKPLTKDREDDLRQIGATAELITAIKANSPSSPNTPLGNAFVLTDFARIPAGTFQMGSDNALELFHKVQITKEFWMLKTEVTQKQWRAVMGSLPQTICYDENRAEDFISDNKPVICVNWENAQEFIQRLNAKGDGYKYRLPTEAEWEYAARAGMSGVDKTDLAQTAWFAMDEPTGSPQNVAGKKPNDWGLYDMQSNVSEWVSDWYDRDYYKVSPTADPTGPQTGVIKVVRGGAYVSNQNDVRVTTRLDANPSLRGKFVGFRIIRMK